MFCIFLWEWTLGENKKKSEFVTLYCKSIFRKDIDLRNSKDLLMIGIKVKKKESNLLVLIKSRQKRSPNDVTKVFILFFYFHFFLQNFVINLELRNFDRYYTIRSKQYGRGIHVNHGCWPIKSFLCTRLLLGRASHHSSHLVTK